MKIIQATLGYEALVDDEDFELVSQYRWYAHNNTGRGHRPARRTSVADGRKVVFLHHEILGKPALGFVIDHINGDPWDNRRSNLRFCTNAENLRNRKAGANRHGFKGVALGVRGKGFRAAITCDGKSYHLGTFDDPEAAARAYDAAARELHGEFARLNFPVAA